MRLSALKEVVAELTLENRLLKKSVIGGWGGRRMRYPASEKLEIIRLVEQSHLPVRRTLEKLGIPRATFYRWYDLYQTGGPEALDDRSPRPDRVWNRIPDDVRERIIEPGAGRAGTLAAGAGRALHRYGKLFCVGGFGLSPAQGPRSDRQPGLHRHEGGRRVQGQDHGAQPALADRLHLSEGHRLGMVLSVDRARRLLALHHRLEAVHDDEGRGCHRHARTWRCRLRGSTKPGSPTGPGCLSDNGSSYIAGDLAKWLDDQRHGSRPRRSLPSP